MIPIPINLAVEDLLSEVVARRLLATSGKNYVIGAVYGREGNGYLKKTSRGWNNAAQGVPFFLLTDLDDVVCPAALKASWLAQPLHRNLIFRVAVREIESWILADRVNFAKFLGIGKTLVPERPDELTNPKATLVSLAAQSPLNAVRSRIVPKPPTTAKQGRDYNGCLSEFVMGQWLPDEAVLNSPSLLRCRRQLAAFVPLWPG